MISGDDDRTFTLDESRALADLLPHGRLAVIHDAGHLPFVEQPISSTEIRDDRRRGAQVSQWLPPMVWNYIEKHKLYS